MPDNYHQMLDVKPVETKEDLGSEVPPKQLFNYNLKHLKSFKHDGKHITVNTIQELHEAEKNLRKI